MKRREFAQAIAAVLAASPFAALFKPEPPRAGRYIETAHYFELPDPPPPPVPEDVWLVHAHHLEEHRRLTTAPLIEDVVNRRRYVVRSHSGGIGARAEADYIPVPRGPIIEQVDP